MEIIINPEKDLQYVVISGRLDASNAAALQEKLMAVVDEGHKRLLVCLEQVEYISSSGLRAFLAVAKKAGPGGYVRFCCLQPNVKEVFTISGFNSIFGIYDSKEEGMA